MIVDSHVHILPDRVRDNCADIGREEPWFDVCYAEGKAIASAESLIAAMDRNGVDRAVCFSWPFASPQLCREANEYVAAAVARHPARLTGCAVIQPQDPGAIAEVERCLALGLRGVGELNADAQGWDLGDAGTDALFAAIARHRLPVNLHSSEPVGRSYPGKGTATPDRLMAFAERNPDLTLILAHLGGGLPLFASIPEIAEVCRRIWFDTAAQPFVWGPSVYRAVIDACGAERILFGSDHPLLDLPRYQAALAAAQISVEHQALILGRNAVALYG